MSSITLDRDTLDGLSGRLERVAVDFTDAERSQLVALLAVGSSEVARLAGLEPADGDQVDVLAGGFSEALYPLTAAGPPREVEPFGAAATSTSSGGFSASGSVTVQPGSLCVNWGGWTASGSVQSGHSSSSSSGGTGGKPK